MSFICALFFVLTTFNLPLNSYGISLFLSVFLQTSVWLMYFPAMLNGLYLYVHSCACGIISRWQLGVRSLFEDCCMIKIQSALKCDVKGFWHDIGFISIIKIQCIQDIFNAAIFKKTILTILLLHFHLSFALAGPGHIDYCWGVRGSCAKQINNPRLPKSQ